MQLQCFAARVVGPPQQQRSGGHFLPSHCSGSVLLVGLGLHTSVRTMHMPRIPEHEASDQPPRNAQVMIRDLVFFGFVRFLLLSAMSEPVA